SRRDAGDRLPARRAARRGITAGHGGDAATFGERGMTPIIETKGLTRKLGDFTPVDDLSIAVAPGSIFAFLGANGSGKSTTIRMLIGVLTPTSGSISVDGGGG